MIAVHSKQVVKKLLDSGRWPASLCFYLLQRIEELKKALGEAGLNDDEMVSLEDYGYPMLLEDTDKLDDLEDAGLNRAERGLYGVVPEVVERLVFADCAFFCISVVFNNDYIIEFLLRDDRKLRGDSSLMELIARWGWQVKNMQKAIHRRRKAA